MRKRRRNPVFAPVGPTWYNAVAWRYRANPDDPWERRDVMGTVLWVYTPDPRWVIAQRSTSRFYTYYKGELADKAPAWTLVAAKKKAHR